MHGYLQWGSVAVKPSKIVTLGGFNVRVLAAAIAACNSAIAVSISILARLTPLFAVLLQSGLAVLIVGFGWTYPVSFLPL
jgi:hypothetical protein